MSSGRSLERRSRPKRLNWPHSVKFINTTLKPVTTATSSTTATKTVTTIATIGKTTTTPTAAATSKRNQRQ